jgi:hypothetical protein
MTRLIQVVVTGGDGVNLYLKDEGFEELRVRVKTTDQRGMKDLFGNVSQVELEDQLIFEMTYPEVWAAAKGQYRKKRIAE